MLYVLGYTVGGCEFYDVPYTYFETLEEAKQFVLLEHGLGEWYQEDNTWEFSQSSATYPRPFIFGVQKK